jgi:hypothetical protein
MRVVRFLSIAVAAFAVFAVFAAGCSSSGTSVPVAPVGAPQAPVLPAASAFAATSAVAPSASETATTLSLPLPGDATYSGTATFPVAAVPPNLRLTLTYSNAPPADLTPFATARLPAADARKPLDAFSTNAVYACFAANYVVTLNGAPQYRFVLPPGWDPAGIVYYLALWQNGKWVSGYGGPGAIAATSTSTVVTVAGRFPFVIPADGKVCVALYGRWTTAPTPVPATPAPSTVPATPSASPSASPEPSASPVPSASPEPSPSPEPTGTPSPSISPAALTFTSAGVQKSLLVTEIGYTGVLTQSNACGEIATVSPASGTGPSATFGVTSVAAGSCTITVTDSAGRSATATVGVTTLGVTINSKVRRP